MIEAHEILQTPVIAGFEVQKAFAIGAAATTLIGAGGALLSKGCTIVSEGDMGLPMRSGKPFLRKEYEKKTPIELRRIYNRVEDECWNLFDVSQDELEWMKVEDRLPKGIYDIRGAGKVWHNPVFSYVVKIAVAEQVTSLGIGENKRPVQITSSDGKVFDCNPSIGWHVIPYGDNPYKALVHISNEKDKRDKWKIEELQQLAASASREALGRVLSTYSEDELHTYDEWLKYEITDKTERACRERLYEKGITLSEVDLNKSLLGEEVLGARLGTAPAPERIQTVAARSRSKALRSRDGEDADVIPMFPDRDSAA